MSAELLTSRPTESDIDAGPHAVEPRRTQRAASGHVRRRHRGARHRRERDPSIRAVVITGADNFFCAGGNLNRLLENRAKDPSVQAESIDLLGEWISALRSFDEAGDRRRRRRRSRRGILARARVRPDRRRRRCQVRHVVCTRRPDARRRRLVVPRASAAASAGHRSADRRQSRSAPRVCTNSASSTNWSRPAPCAMPRSRGPTSSARFRPTSVARIKGLISAAGTQSLADHLVAERDSFVASLHHRDGLEGITAFLEKRAPVYR